MTELATRESSALETYLNDPTGGRLVAWAQAASAAHQLAKAIVQTTFCPQAFKNNPGDATAAILCGDELGLSPLASLRSLYVVHGTPAMYARTMVALAQSRGHRIWTEASSDQRVIVCGQRRGQEHVERAEWTLDRARKAGYTSNKKYASNPAEMLYSKAAAEVARKIAADVLAGVPFSVEDLELEEPEPTTTAQRTATTTPAKRTARRAQSQPVPEPDFDDTPAPAADPEPSGLDEFTTVRITDPQLKKLQILYRELQIEDRDERLADASSFVGRDLTSSAELTKDEASRLIDDLEQRNTAQDPGEAELFGGERA